MITPRCRRNFPSSTCSTRGFLGVPQQLRSFNRPANDWHIGSPKRQKSATIFFGCVKIQAPFMSINRWWTHLVGDLNVTICWLVVSTHLKNMLVKMGSSSPTKGENRKCLKPPARDLNVTICRVNKNRWSSNPGFGCCHVSGKDFFLPNITFAEVTNLLRRFFGSFLQQHTFALSKNLHQKERDQLLGGENGSDRN